MYFALVKKIYPYLDLTNVIFHILSGIQIYSPKISLRVFNANCKLNSTHFVYETRIKRQ